MIDMDVLLKAGEVYERVGALDDAVRCYLDSTMFGRATKLLLRLGRFEELARVYADGLDVEAAAWLYVHELESPATARLLLTELPPPISDYPDDNAWYDALLECEIAWISRFQDDLKKRYAVDPRVSPAAGPGVLSGTGNRVDREAREDYLDLIEDAIDRCDPMVFKSGEQTVQDFVERLADELGEFCEECERADSPDSDLVIAANALFMRVYDRVENDLHYGRLSTQVIQLMRDLVVARCDIAEGVNHRGAIPVLGRVQDVLASGAPLREGTAYRDLHEWHHVEEWSIALAQLTHRYDQAALVFAASVRGGFPGAAQRWRAWSKRVLGVEISVDERHETVVTDE